MRISVLTPPEKAVFLALVRGCDDNGICTYTQTWLTSCTHYSLSTVIKSIAALKEMGALSKEYDKHTKLTTYYVDLKYFSGER